MSGERRGISFFHPPGHLVRPANPFGKDVANAALFRSLLESGALTDISVLNQLGLDPGTLASGLKVPEFVRLGSGSLTDTTIPAQHGTLLRGQPYLAELAWERRAANFDTAYSLVGLIHTIAPPVVRSQIAAAAIAPTHGWDALVCTSPCVQKSITDLFDAQADYLRFRLGAKRIQRPHLPLIPLAVDIDSLSKAGQDYEARTTFRQKLRVASDDVLLLWVGRLSYYEKAFPQSMFQAMRLASQQVDHQLHFLLIGWFPGGSAEMELYSQAAQHLAPDLNVIVMDGNNPDNVRQGWAAADIFFSLVDNIQETFGLTPVEAMAAGLPVVASDWDGYRYTVRDGVDGFLVPTLLSPSTANGESLASLHALEMATYQTYVGAVAQHTAVNVQFAASVIVRLAQSKELRRALGSSAQQRASQEFSWRSVVAEYCDLFDDLASRRGLASKSLSIDAPLLNPSRGEPFKDFRHFASHVLEPTSVLKLSNNAKPSDLHRRLSVKLNTFYSGLRGTNEEAFDLLLALERSGSDGLSVAELCEVFAPSRRSYIELTLVWLAKMDLVDWL